MPRITKFIKDPIAPIGNAIRIDGSEITELDTAGAFLMFTLAIGEKRSPREVTLIGFSEHHRNVAKLVQERWRVSPHDSDSPPFTIVERIGEKTLSIINGLRNLFAFIGEALANFGATVLNPKLFRAKEFFVQLELVCVDAIPIVALVTALIGIVVSYLFAMQLLKYGATVFIVDGVVLAMARELAPIVVAITLAGRSGSAFTAQIGTMKINEEIDAMIVTGLSPMRVLVIPRVLALVTALPLMTFLGTVVGTLGGLVIAHWYAGISPTTFFDRIQSNFPYKSFYLGLVKAPVFAAFIAIIGCQMGLGVENNARSVGINTTSTVVQSIVSVIILDALFAVLFAQVGFY